MKRISRSTFDELRALPWPFHREEECPSVPLNDGCYLLHDESGKGVLGVLRMEDAVLRSATMNFLSKGEVLDMKYYAPVQEVEWLQAFLFPLNAKAFVEFTGQKRWRVSLEGEAFLSARSFLKWDEVIREESFKSLLVELGISDTDVWKFLTQMDSLEIQFVSYFYSPDKGLYLP